jgi:hypothetical protein
MHWVGELIGSFEELLGWNERCYYYCYLVLGKLLTYLLLFRI